MHGSATLGRWIERGMLLAAVVVTRLPFAGPGYGTDPDAWRVVRLARALSLGATYEASRRPGYPVQELGSALLWSVSPTAPVWGTVAMTALAALGLHEAIRRAGGRGALGAALLFAFSPEVWIQSTSAMDYLWALAFSAWALVAAAAGVPLVAGLLLGLAAGCRLTALAAALPVALLLWDRAAPPWESLRRVGQAAVASVVVSAAALVAPLRAYGMAFFPFDVGRMASSGGHSLRHDLGVLWTASADLLPWPLLALVALVAGIGARRSPRAAGWAALVAAAGALPTVAAYLLLPHDPAYLLPVVAWLAYAVGVAASRGGALLLAAGAVAASFAVAPTASDTPARAAVGVYQVEVAGRTWSVDLRRGPLLVEARRRARDGDLAGQAVAALDALPAGSVVVAGWLEPQIRLALEGQGGAPRGVRVVLGVSSDDGSPLYFLPGADRDNLQRMRFALPASASPLLPGL